MDKWKMFKNYMHNELEITKEDIRGWIEESVQQEVKVLVSNQVNDFSIDKYVSREVYKTKYFQGGSLKRDILAEISKEIISKISIKIDEK